MSIHAKSLNQLAFELEMRAQAKAAPEQPRPQTESDSAAPSDTAMEFAKLRKFIADLGASGNGAEELEATALACPPLVEITKAAPQEPPFYMDSTLGVRTRPAQRAQAHKSGLEVRLYSGFASRGGITGKE